MADPHSVLVVDDDAAMRDMVVSPFREATHDHAVLGNLTCGLRLAKLLAHGTDAGPPMRLSKGDTSVR